MGNDQSHLPRIVGRGAHSGPGNRFERIHIQADLEQLEHDPDLAADRRVVPTEFYPDATQSIIAENDSPDVGFRYSINAYRGCEHGCAYCYARPGHEYLGMNAGLDFESKIMVKLRAAELLRDALNRPSWRGEMIAMSGVTDCYQPAERHFRLTRSCLEVLLEAQQACGLITKNALVTRDLDLLQPLAELNLTRVFVSVTTLDAELARTLEPRTATPAARLAAIRELSEAGVSVGAMVAPIIPGLNDSEVPAILAAISEAGAKQAGFTLLRLPGAVEPVFNEWLQRERPELRDRILSRIRTTRGGKLSDAQFGSRMRGDGQYAEQIAQTFRVFAHKHGLNKPLPPLDCSRFRPPTSNSGQKRLF